jgi:hypothetical protein
MEVLLKQLDLSYGVGELKSFGICADKQLLGLLAK